MIRHSYSLRLKPIRKRKKKVTKNLLLESLYPDRLGFQKAQSCSSKLTEIIHAEKEHASLLFGEITIGQYSELREAIKERNPNFFKQGKKIVDVGTGRNLFLMEAFLHRSSFPCEFIGYEISPSRYQQGENAMKLLLSKKRKHQFESMTQETSIQNAKKKLTIKNQNFLDDEKNCFDADLLFMNVELLFNNDRIQNFFYQIKLNAILITYDEIHLQIPKFLSFYVQLPSIRIQTSWSPLLGSSFHCYQRKDIT
jgi:hypothetical protein